MMSSKCETSSIRTMATVIAISALSLTTTLTTNGNEISPSVIMGNLSDNDVGTTTLSPKVIATKASSSFESARQLFAGNMRDFTKEEAAIYRESLNKIYKPMGVNIFDIC